VTKNLKNILKTIFFLTIQFQFYSAELIADDWGGEFRLRNQDWGKSSQKRGKSSKLRKKEVSLIFVDQEKQLRLPFWYRRAGSSNSEWKWVGAKSEIDQNDLEYILEFDLGFDYLKPLPLQTGTLGIRDKSFVARPWHGDAWSPYSSAYFSFDQKLKLPNDLRWLEAWQVSAGIKTVIWPLEWLSRYPRSSLISSKQGTWRSLCQQITSMGNVEIRSISEKPELLAGGVRTEPFSWDKFIESMRQLDWNLVNAYAPFSHQEEWEGKWIHPLIPILFAGAYIDILELSNEQDLAHYRYLIEQGHRISQVMRFEKNESSVVQAPDLSIYRHPEGISDFWSLKNGKFSSSSGFAFDWVLKSENKNSYRSGDFFTISESPLMPMFRFSKHPNFSPLVEVRLYKGTELMVRSKVPENISKGTIDLGRYYFEEHDNMSLEILHKNGRISTLNPIYAGEDKFFHSKVRDLPLKVLNLSGDSVEVTFLKSKIKKSFPLSQSTLVLEVPWYETLFIESNGTQKKIDVWRLWLDKAVNTLPVHSTFEAQYQAFERSFPLIYSWSS
jgi:hypothetical protein